MPSWYNNEIIKSAPSVHDNNYNHQNFCRARDICPEVIMLLPYVCRTATTTRFTDEPHLRKFTAVTSVSLQTHHFCKNLRSCRRKNVLNGFSISQHSLILCTSRAQIFQQVLIRRASVCQILMQSCYRLLQ